MTTEIDILVNNPDIAEAVETIHALENTRKQVLALCIIGDTLEQSAVERDLDDIKSTPELLLDKETKETRRKAIERASAALEFIDALAEVE